MLDPSPGQAAYCGHESRPQFPVLRAHTPSQRRDSEASKHFLVPSPKFTHWVNLPSSREEGRSVSPHVATLGQGISL